MWCCVQRAQLCVLSISVSVSTGISFGSFGYSVTLPAAQWRRLGDMFQINVVLGAPIRMSCSLQVAGHSSSCVLVAWKENLPVGDNGNKGIFLPTCMYL